MSDPGATPSLPGQEEPTPPRARPKLRRLGEGEQLPLTGHLEELRWRLIYCATTVFALFVLFWSFADTLFALVRLPLGDHPLIAIAPGEAFFAYMQVSFYAAVAVAMPVLLYHAWEFVAPGLLAVERRYTGWFVVMGSLFFVGGGAFCYFVVLPYGLDFLLTFAGDQILSQTTVDYYLSFVVKMTLAFGIVFEMPVVVVLLARIGLVTPQKLAHIRPYVVVGCFVVGAILTPPDVFSQLIMAVPMVILYELSIIVARIMARPRQAASEEN
ncbi:MAG: twin-arginine translocase subunit TatC [Nitrospinae bacterium]|nr:twin-arginine translocase subunit TatC [Nitrospinota bacterium]